MNDLQALGGRALVSFICHFLLVSDAVLTESGICTSTSGFAILLRRHFMVLVCTVAIGNDAGKMTGARKSTFKNVGLLDFLRRYSAEQSDL